MFRRKAGKTSKHASFIGTYDISPILFRVFSTSSPHNGYKKAKLTAQHPITSIKYPKCTHLAFTKPS